MNKTKVLLMLCTFFLLSNNLPAQSPPAILVLGFNSKQMTDVQDRLLREQILRLFLEKNYRIVSVMDIESIGYINGKNIRNLALSDIKKLATRFQADYTLTGTITHSKNANIIDLGKTAFYVCTVAVYKRETNSSFTFKFTLQGKDSLLQFYNDCSRTIYAHFSQSLKQAK